MKPKLLIFINTLQIGGSERVVSLLLQNLNKEFDIHLAMYTNIIEYSIPEDIKIIDLRQPLNQGKFRLLLNAPSIAYKLAGYCRKNNIRTSVAFLYRPCFINALMKVVYGFKGRIVMCERTHQSAILSGYNWFHRFVIRSLVKFSYNKADLVLANSYVMQEDLVRNLNISTPIRVIYNPVDIEFINSQSHAAPAFEFEEGIFYFINVGGFRKEKNQMLLIESFFILRHLPCRLILIGGGTEEERCIQKVKELGIEDRVIFHGFDVNPFSYLLRADCFVLSSDVEGFPNVLLEALACGKAIVSTDCASGPRELLDPANDIHKKAVNHFEIGEFGILSPVNDIAALASAMKKIFEDDSLRKTFEIKARERAAEFEVKQVKQYFHLAFSGK